MNVNNLGVVTNAKKDKKICKNPKPDKTSKFVIGMFFTYCRRKKGYDKLYILLLVLKGQS